MNTCDKCKWWGEPESNSPTARTCMNYDCGMCPLAEGGAGWGSGTGIETEPDFGCNKFEANA